MAQIAAVAAATLVLIATPHLMAAGDPAAGLTAIHSQRAADADTSVPATLRSIIAKTLKVDEKRVTATATFVKDLRADELALVELVMAYEREFKVRISDAEADRFLQVRDVVAYLRKRGVLK